IEIESGLKLGKRIIPVLVNGAEMPRVEHLPASLKLFSRRNAVRLTHERFKSDAQGLIVQLEKALEEAATVRRAQAEVQSQQKRKADDAVAARETAKQKLNELEAWESANATGTVEAYTSFIGAWPHGAHADAARGRLREIRYRRSAPLVWKVAGAVSVLVVCG